MSLDFKYILLNYSLTILRVQQLESSLSTSEDSECTPAIIVAGVVCEAAAVDMVTVLSSDEEETAEDGDSSDGSEQQACKRCRFSPDLFATTTSTATSPRHSSVR